MTPRLTTTTSDYDTTTPTTTTSDQSSVVVLSAVNRTVSHCRQTSAPITPSHVDTVTVGDCDTGTLAVGCVAQDIGHDVASHMQMNCPHTGHLPPSAVMMPARSRNSGEEFSSPGVGGNSASTQLLCAGRPALSEGPASTAAPSAWLGASVVPVAGVAPVEQHHDTCRPWKVGAVQGLVGGWSSGTSQSGQWPRSSLSPTVPRLSPGDG